MAVYILPLLISAGVAAIVSYVGWQYRRVAGAISLMALMATMAVWALGYALQLASVDFPTKLFLDRLITGTYASVPVLVLTLAVQLAGHGWWLTRRRLLLLFAIPVITELMALTNGVNGLWQSGVHMDISGPFPMVSGENGLWYWVHAFYSYLLLMVSVVLMGGALVQAWRGGAQPQYAGQLLMVLLSLVVALAPNVAYVAGLELVHGYDPTPVAFSLSGVIMALGLFRYRLFDIVPTAYATIVESLGDGVIMLDAQNRLAEINPAAQLILGQPASQVVGRPVADVLAAWPALLAFCLEAAGRQAETAREREGVVRHYELRGSPLPGRWGQSLGRIVTLHDFTVRKQAEEELLRRNEELAALNAVAQAVSMVQDLPSALGAVAREVTGVFRAMRCGVALFNPARTELTVVADYCAVPEAVRGVGLVLPLAGNPASARVLETRRTLVIPEAQTNPLVAALHPIMRERRIHCLMVAPLLARGEVIGTIGVDLDEVGRTFSPAEVSLMETLAGQLAGAVENSRLFGVTQRRVVELATLTDIGKALTATLRVEALLQLIYEQTCRLMYAEKMSIALYDPPRHEIEFVFTRNVEETLPGSRQSAEEGLNGHIIRERRAIRLRNDTQLTPQGLGLEPIGQQAAAWMGVPMLIADPRVAAGERVLGVISVQHYTDVYAYDETHQALLEAIASQAAIALENARLFDETQRRVAELGALADIGRAISSTLDLDALLKTFFAEISKVMDTSNFTVALYDAESNLLSLPIHRVHGAAMPAESRPLGADLMGAVIQERKSRLILNAGAGLLPALAPAGPSPAAWLGVPLIFGAEVLGAIIIESETANVYTEDDRRFLEAAADQAAVAIKNAQLYTETRHRADEADGLNRIGALLAATLEMDEILTAIYAETQPILRATAFSVALYDEATQELRFELFVNRGRRLDKFTRPLAAAPLNAWMIRERQPLFVRDADREPHPEIQVAEGWTEWLPKSVVGVPLIYKGRAIGVMVAQSEARLAFDIHQKQVLEGIAHLAASALENARLLRELQAIAAENARLYHAAQREKQYFESLVLNSPAAIVVTDLNRRVTGWNPSAETLFGYTETEALGQALADLGLGDLGSAAEALAEGATGGRVAHTFTQRTRKDDTLVEVELFSVPVSIAGERVGLLMLYHDVTALQRARHEAETANRAKSEFLANMSHEIRTPMNAIIGMTDLLLDTPLNPRQREFADTVRHSGEALLTLINDILDFSKIEAGKLDLEAQPFDLRECVELALDVVAARAMEKHLDLTGVVETPVPTAIIGDSARLRQILINLLGNAIKFTDQGEVALTVSARAETSPAPALEPERPEVYALHFAVRDTGIGISPEQTGKLFQSFSQLDPSATRRYGGTGLGLAISKRLVEMLGGTIWVESEGRPGRGSVFHVTFSVRAATLAEPIYLSGDQPSLCGRRILVVAGNPTLRQWLTQQAHLWGMVAQAAATAREALDYAQQGEMYDVALLDQQLPDMDGPALAETLRKTEALAALPLVLLTALKRPEMPDHAQLFAAYLTKPVKASQLYDALLQILVETGAGRERFGPEAPVLGLDAEMGRHWPLRILLAEDNLTNRKLATYALERLGYYPDVASTGTQVLQALRRRSYEVVLMDVQMPEMDGLEATRRIRAEFPPGSQPRIVAMTANAMRGDREACLAAGMDDYLSKPIRLVDLVAALRQSVPAGSGWEGPVTEVAAPAPGGEAEAILDRAMLDSLRQMGGGEAGFLEDLIGAFRAETPPLLAAMGQAAAAGDAAGLRLGAHSLKSNSANFGALTLSSLCRDLEQRARAGVLAGATEQLAQIEAEYARVAAALEALRPG
jgi:PAS domain S-box-containing protein